jgi:glycine/D-amino acid oxidase-like deaminating enzyme
VPDAQHDTNRSVWTLESPPAAASAPLRGRLVTDIAIIGGGLTGVSTAWHLRRQNPGLGIALLEARTLGHGASGRNGGQVLNGVNGAEAETPEALRRIHGATRAGIELAEQLAARFAPAGCFRRQGCLKVYTDARRAERAAAHVEVLRGVGIPAEFLAGSRLGIRGAKGAVLSRWPGV